MKTQADVTKALKGFYDSNIQALQGVIDKLPEALRGDLKKLYDDLNTQLAKLPPLEQVPAASEAAGSLNYLVDCVTRMNEYSARMMERLGEISKSLATTTAAYQGLDDRIKSGDLMSKDAVKDLVESARKESAEALLPQIVSSRKQQVELAGLPDPGEDVLKADTFATRFDEAKANLGKLTAKGFSLKGRGAGLIKDLAWLGTAEFAGRLSGFEDVLVPGTAKAGGDPLLGGGNPEETKVTKSHLLSIA